MVGFWAFTTMAWAQSLVGELKSCKPHSAAKKKKKEAQRNVLKDTWRMLNQPNPGWGEFYRTNDSISSISNWHLIMVVIIID